LYSFFLINLYIKFYFCIVANVFYKTIPYLKVKNKVNVSTFAI
jgi:hypothetical protein